MLEVWAVLKSFAAVVGFFRLIFKPIMTIIENAVKDTETETDDLILEKILGSKFYRVFTWFVDYFGSIKLGVSQKAFKAKKIK